MTVGEVVDMMVEEEVGTLGEEVVDMALEEVLKDLRHQIGHCGECPFYMLLL